eukprot:1189018-Prorocentrum_minimum.AAC.1
MFSSPFCDWCPIRVYSLSPSAIGARYGWSSSLGCRARGSYVTFPCPATKPCRCRCARPVYCESLVNVHCPDNSRTVTTSTSARSEPAPVSSNALTTVIRSCKAHAKRHPAGVLPPPTPPPLFPPHHLLPPGRDTQ